MDKVLSIENLSIRYKTSGGLFKKPSYHIAFEGLSFDVLKGETLGVQGRNGAGKSTLLRVISGILQPNEGRIINYGYSVSLLALGAGFDAQLSGHDNAILNGMFLGYTKKEILAKIDDIKEFSELGNFFDQPIKNYSSGMRSRLGFSVAMYLTPDILLLDEVLSVGDKEFRKKAEDEMHKKIHSEQTVILVSHSENQVKRLCDRVIQVK